MTRDRARLGAIVLARLDSSRLPRKVLVPVGGKLILAYVVERAMAAEGVDQVVLATTAREVDTPLETFADSMGIGIFRGSLHDVAGRVLACARAFSLDAFARVNGDSPLLDFELLSRAVAEFRRGDYDIVTNVLKRTYPPGISVEVLDTDVFAEGYQCMTEPQHFEHVTKFFYERPDEWRIKNIESGRDGWDRIHAAVDTPSDIERFRRIVGRMEGGHLRYAGEDLLDLLRNCEPPQSSG